MRAIWPPTWRPCAELNNAMLPTEFDEELGVVFHHALDHVRRRQTG